MNNKTICVIPTRYGSSRFPGKPLALISGKPMIQWVYERTAMAKKVSDVIVATDDQRIFDAVVSFGGKVVMTGECECGTDRVYQASLGQEFDVVINVQGDEPLIRPEMIDQLCEAFDDDGVYAATMRTLITSDSEVNDPNAVKVITDINGDAIYFSRNPIPYNREKRDDVQYYKHIGMYGYKKEFLEEYVNLGNSYLENVEKLEQLRILENGYKIRVVETTFKTIGVDLPEHIDLIEKMIAKGESTDE